MKNTPKEKNNKTEIAVVQEKTEGMEKMVESFKITTDEELGLVADEIKKVKTLQKYIEQEKDKLVDPAKAIIAEAKEKYDPFIKKCQNAEIVLKERAKAYMTQKEQKRIEDEKKIAARVEKGTMKPETAVKKLEALPEAQNTVSSESGSRLRMSKRKVAEIVEPKLIPAEYWVIDEVRVRREALARDKEGISQIPGVVIREVSDLASL